MGKAASATFPWTIDAYFDQVDRNQVVLSCDLRQPHGHNNWLFGRYGRRQSATVLKLQGQGQADSVRLSRAYDFDDFRLDNPRGHILLDDVYFEIADSHLFGFSSGGGTFAVIVLPSALATAQRLADWDNWFGSYAAKGGVGFGDEGVAFAKLMIAKLSPGRADRILAAYEAAR